MKKIGLLLFAVMLLSGCGKQSEVKPNLAVSGVSIQQETKNWDTLGSSMDRLQKDTREILDIVEPKNPKIDVVFYESKKGKFSLTLDSNRWFQENVWNSIVVFSREWLSGTSKASISINELELPNPEEKISLEDYYSQNKLSIRDSITDFTEISQKKTKIDWYKALEVVYNWEQNSQRFQIKQMFFQKASKMFIITYLSSQEIFSQYLPESDSIIESMDLD